MAEPRWDDIKEWVEQKKEENMSRLRRHGVDLRSVDEANAKLDLLDELLGLEKEESMPDVGPETFV